MTKNFDIYSPIFTNQEDSILFLKNSNLLPENKTCPLCLECTLKLLKDKSRTHGLFYKCFLCDKKIGVFSNTVFKGCKIKINIIFRFIYCFVANFDQIQSSIITSLDLKTIIELRKKIIMKIKEKKDELFKKIGGENIRVQVDETAICRGKIIINPSDTLDDDEKNEIQWLIGGIEEKNRNNVFLEIISNRQAPTILDVFRRNLNSGSIIITDGYPSYPSAVKDFKSKHIIVPHTEGFTNKEGDNTNMIENLWSHLKVEYKIRRGIMRHRMKDFIYEFYFKKVFIIKRNKDFFEKVFIKILKLLFENK
ncbi:hypothetical protein EQH57_0084 [Dictyocoela roeselum]|nr:hypothetical protein EQH57_0084 [Dictyocoela roeselum]